MTANDIIEKCAKEAESCTVVPEEYCSEIAYRIRALKSSLPAETVSEAMVEQARLIIANEIKCNGFVKSSGLCVRGTLEKHCDCREASRQILALAPADDGWRPTDAARDVLAERRRQVEQEGWTPEHDARHAAGDLADAAACYASTDRDLRHGVPFGWPWSAAWWKPTDRRRDLVKAGALIIAEIERLDRVAILSAASALEQKEQG